MRLYSHRTKLNTDQNQAYTDTDPGPYIHFSFKFQPLVEVFPSSTTRGSKCEPSTTVLPSMGRSIASNKLVSEESLSSSSCAKAAVATVSLASTTGETLTKTTGAVRGVSPACTRGSTGLWLAGHSFIISIAVSVSSTEYGGGGSNLGWLAAAEQTSAGSELSEYNGGGSKNAKTGARKFLGWTGSTTVPSTSLGPWFWGSNWGVRCGDLEQGTTWNHWPFWWWN